MGIHLANKVRKSHIKFQGCKMKVKLATQVLSKSVATALEYLQCSVSHPLFKNVGGAIVFAGKLTRHLTF